MPEGGGSALGDRLAAGLAALERDNLKRRRRVLDSGQGPRVRLDGRELLNFSSNDYLGLAAHPKLAQAVCDCVSRYGVGSGASPLVTGHTRVHEQAEARFAAFAGLPRALLFASGYAANIGILTALAGPDGAVFGDRLNHACLNDGAWLSRASHTRYPHLDLAALEAGLARATGTPRIVATDSVFSMDGDIAPLPQMLALCERYDAWLVVDDAHGVGVLGERGRGCLEHFGLASPRIVYMATLGKALGGYGAFVAGESRAIEWLLQRARTYIFSTALPPMVAAAAHAAIDLVDAEPGRIARLRERIAQFRAGCAHHGIPVGESQTAVQPIVVGAAERALEVAARLLEHHVLVPAIRPPTVPAGTSRLRVSLSAEHTPEDVDKLVRALADCFA